MSTTDYNENVHQYANEQTSIQALDKHITHEEVMKAIQNLCRGKSSGSFLVIIYIQQNGPCYIIPIPKKGDLTDVNNYRVITIMSVFAKLFSIILNNRLTQ